MDESPNGSTWQLGSDPGAFALEREGVPVDELKLDHGLVDPLPVHATLEQHVGGSESTIC